MQAAPRTWRAGRAWVESVHSLAGMGRQRMARAAADRKTRTWHQVRPERRTSIPEGLWLRCSACGKMVYRRNLEANLHVCPECSHHHRISAAQRVEQLADPDSFQELFTNLGPTDPLHFKDLKTYKDRLLAEQ